MQTAENISSQPHLNITFLTLQHTFVIPGVLYQKHTTTCNVDNKKALADHMSPFPVMFTGLPDHLFNSNVARNTLLHKIQKLWFHPCQTPVVKSKLKCRTSVKPISQALRQGMLPLYLDSKTNLSTKHTGTYENQIDSEKEPPKSQQGLASKAINICLNSD